MNKKAVSALVATVLLIATTISVGLIIFSFTRTSSEQVTEQFTLMANQVECSDIDISIDSFDGTELILKNRGTLGVSDIMIRDYQNDPKKASTSSWNKEREPDVWDPYTWEKLLPGEKIKTDLTATKVEIIPIIVIDDQNIGCENSIRTRTA